MTSTVEWPGWFALSLPPGWEYEDGEDVITLFDPNGVGAMTVSGARRVDPDGPSVTEARDIALHFAKQRDWAVTAQDVATRMISGIPAAHVSCRESDDHWDVWGLLDRDRAVLITYVANADDAEVERDARESIVASLRWLSPLPV